MKRSREISFFQLKVKACFMSTTNSNFGKNDQYIVYDISSN